MSNIGLISDVPMEMTIVLGTKRMSIKDVLKLGPGSMVELDKQAGEPVDVMVNDKVIARGEVVVVDGDYGVRLTQVLSL